MNTETAIKLAGSPSMLARILGVSSAAVSQFRARERLPDVRALQLYMLRPEWFVGLEPPVVRPRAVKAKANTGDAN